MTPPLIALPASTPVDWFSDSARVIDGKPDARYGWAETPDGPCIIKALDLKLGPSIASLLDHERAALSLLRARGAPVPELLLAESPGWLATRFSGLSLRVLAGLPGAAADFSVDERLGAWIHFLRRAEVFVSAGALPIDLWDGNLVLPLTRQTSGQIVLQDVVMIDHAHTVITGMHLRRPVMIGAHMDRIAPELRQYLEADQAGFIRAFREADAPFPQTTAAVRDLEARSAQIFTAYDADQQVQQALDDGKLDIAAAMQFAAAVAIERLLPMLTSSAQQQSVFEALRRMKAQQPGDRFASLTEASDALRKGLGALPRTGHHQYAQVRPATLKPLPLPELARPGPATVLAEDVTQHVALPLDEISEEFISLDDAPTQLAAIPEAVAPTLREQTVPVQRVPQAPGQDLTPHDSPGLWRWAYGGGLLAGGLLGSWLATRGL